MNEEAELLFTQTWIRTNNRFSDVLSFWRYTLQSLEHVKKATDLEYSKFVQSLASDKEFNEIIIDKKAFFEAVGGADKLSTELAQKQIESYRIAIDSSSIILAHSALEAAAFDYFRVIEIVAPLEDLEKYVIKKQISLEELKASNYSDLMRQKIHKFVDDLDGKALLEKIDKLFEICQPPSRYSSIEGYVYDRNKVERLDKLRHEIVHGDGIVAALPNCFEEIRYMRDTSNHLMKLVNNKYNVKMNEIALKKALQIKSKT